MPAYFGLDIGSFSIKAVQVEKAGKKYRLSSFGEIAMPVSPASQAETDKRAVAAAIKKLLTETRIGTKEVSLSLPETAVFSQVIELPYLSQTELNAAIDFEAEQYIPIPLDEVKVEYLVLSSSPKGVKTKKIEVLLVAARKTAVQQMVNLVESIGLTPVNLETETLSLVRVANLIFKGGCLLLNLGHKTTSFAILEDQQLKFTRNLNTAGEAFTRAIARDLNMEFLQAQQYKSAYGLNQNALEGKVAKSILPVFSIILTELKKGLNFFLQKNPESRINTLIITGGGAMMPGVNSYLAESLNLEVISLDPFQVFLPEKRVSEIKGKARFSTAIGLAIRED